jgi:hypothetical protein
MIDYKLKGLDKGKSLLIDSMIVGFFENYYNKIKQ